jgi:hypothetical protein
MHAFYKTARVLGESLNTYDDASAEPRHLQRLGYALLDMGKSACRVMKLVVQSVPAAGPEKPGVSVEGGWQVAGRRGKRRN